MPEQDRKQTTADPMDDMHFDTKQAAAYLNCSARFLEIKRIQGGGPRFVRLSPKMIRYRKSDLDDWVAGRVHTSTVY